MNGGINITYVQSYAGSVIGIINYVLIPVLLAIAFFMFLFGVMQAYVFSKGSEAAVTKGHQLVLWGAVGFTIVLSVWGLVALVGSTFGLGVGGAAPPYPTL